LKGERACKGDSKPSQGGISDAEAEHFSSIFEFKGRGFFASSQSSNGITHGFPLLHRDLGIRWGWVFAVDGYVTDGENIKTVLESQISANG
jgi:hypothetical protein